MQSTDSTSDSVIYDLVKTKFSQSQAEISSMDILYFLHYASDSHNLVFTGSYVTEQFKWISIMEYLEYCFMYIYIDLVFLSGRLLRTFYNKDCIRCGLFLGSLVATFKVCIFWD